MMTKSATAKNAAPSISTSLSSGQFAFFRSLFEGSSDAVQLDDTEGQVIFANGAWLSLFQVDAAAAVGAKWVKLVKGRLCKGEQLGRTWSRSKKGGPSQGTVALKADGDARMQVSYTRMPVRGKNDEVLAVVSIFRQEMLEPSDAGGGEIVHDIKNAYIQPRAVEHHINSIFSKLGIAPENGQHARVQAVLAYLKATGQSRQETLVSS